MCEVVVPLEKMKSVKTKDEQKNIAESRRVVNISYENNFQSVLNAKCDMGT